MGSQFDVDEATQTKLCSACKTRKPLDQFGRNKATRSGRKYYCKGCVNESHRKWAQENPDKVTEARERHKDRRRRAYELLRQKEEG